VEYIHCSENKGLSFAYNQGANYARKNNIDWIVLLDQDTAFSEDFICRLNEAIELHSNIKLFAPIIRLNKDRPFSPTRYKHKRGYNLKLKSGLYSLFRYSPVNSGMVVNTISYFESGGYNPLIKLDFSDYQFIERFRKIEGMFYLLNTVAIQDFSNNEKDIDKLIIRFKIYCECARKCERKNIFDSLEYFYSVLRHTIGLLIKTRKIIFLYVFFTNYLIKKSK
jgi:glycosyltransferase involved in cell wall biosynthesis